MERIKPEVKERQGSVTADLSKPGVSEQYIKLVKSFSDEVQKRREKRKKRELEAKRALGDGDIVIEY